MIIGYRPRYWPSSRCFCCARQTAAPRCNSSHFRSDGPWGGGRLQVAPARVCVREMGSDPSSTAGHLWHPVSGLRGVQRGRGRGPFFEPGHGACTEQPALVARDATCKYRPCGRHRRARLERRFSPQCLVIVAAKCPPLLAHQPAPTRAGMYRNPRHCQAIKIRGRPVLPRFSAYLRTFVPGMRVGDPLSHLYSAPRFSIDGGPTNPRNWAFRSCNLLRLLSCAI